ncbi:transglutaminase-like domain-containing protein [Nitrosovibrio sp. Nv17]|uniref:transglutaminase-like domain-containing protein n=1 Tax=Nitrosovibrio sp. Nv17 TaxID=1855339 RepID=UPI0009087EA0|nr:transglutaminase-like domain-containing protein [Nitrosovibrio sp. Nv17]SFW19513.1 Transglutaminase-like enzyme, putative cysteine protease [Nitrosovibrio sp. Nv17]
MKRRDFIRLAGLGGMAASLYPIPSIVSAQQVFRPKTHSYRLTYKIHLPDKGKKARLWLPLPDTNDTPHQFSQGSVWSGNASIARFESIPGTTAPMFYAEWRSSGPRNVVVSSVVKTTDRIVELDTYSERNAAAIPSEVKHYLRTTRHIPLDGIVRKTALSILQESRADTSLKKARAIYDWVVENASYDSGIRGCGRGDVKSMLESGNLGGKCADINALFVGLARAAGIPARDNYGIRIDESATHKPLGRSGDVSTAQHCRPEFYLAGLGWVPVNPADVRQLALDEDLPVTHPRVAALREKLFGTWEMNWVAFNHGQDITLAKDTPLGELPFFMYPQADVSGHIQDSLEPAEFVYQIVSSELVGTGVKF